MDPTGLDNRIGHLGRGFYFSDNPNKSMVYDNCGVVFICAVLLGDCLSMGKKRYTDLNAKPQKMEEQKRNFSDLFFDSVVGRLDGENNEYVIYKRYGLLVFLLLFTKYIFYSVKRSMPSIVYGQL